MRQVVKTMSSVEAAAITGVRSCRSVVQIRTGRVCSVGLAMKIESTTSSQETRKEKLRRQRFRGEWKGSLPVVSLRAGLRRKSLPGRNSQVRRRPSAADAVPETAGRRGPRRRHRSRSGWPGSRPSGLARPGGLGGRPTPRPARNMKRTLGVALCFSQLSTVF